MLKVGESVCFQACGSRSPPCMHSCEDMHGEARVEVMQGKKKDLEKLLLEAIDEGLQEVLGESGREMTFFHLENDYLVKRNDIAQKIEDFATGLEKIFGAGASVLENIIAKKLYSKLGLKYEDKKDYTFANCLNDVEHAKQDIECQSKES